MCTGMEIAAIISGASTAAGALFPGKGKEIEMKQAMSPEMKKLEKFLSKYLMGNVGKTQYAPINPLTLGGADVASQFYLGQPYQHPGIQQYGNPMAPGMAPGGAPRMPMMPGMPGGGGGVNMFGGPGGWQGRGRPQPGGGAVGGTPRPKPRV